MIAEISITEKSFGPKSLMDNVRFTIDGGEKIGLIGRNGIGKSTLFNILTGADTDFSGNIIYKTGVVVVATQQEYHEVGDETVLQYVLQGLPEYSKLSHIIETYPETMRDNLRKISQYTEALQRFDDKGFYQIEEQIEREFDNFQLNGIAHRQFSTLSGGQKRLVDIVKIMHSSASLALIDEPTNHMDYVAKAQFIDWLKQAREGVLVITHDRDVLREVDRIVELKDGSSVSFKGNYDAYLKQNASTTGSQMNEFELVQRRIANLNKRIEYAKSKKAGWGGTADKRNPFVVMETKARKEKAELVKKERPTFWIDKDSVSELNYKTAAQYEKFKARNVRINLKSGESRSKHVLVSARDLSLGYDEPVFSGVNIDLREHEVVEFRGRNGSGKTTLIKGILSNPEVHLSSGELNCDPHIRLGIYEQEVSPTYFELPLEEAIERMYLDNNLPITIGKVRSLMKDYLFEDSDSQVPVKLLSGGQKARFQLISMLANEPQLLILDEPTNHLDLPSIEELETALSKYSGAIIYVSHDGYFRDKIKSVVVQLDK